MSPTKQAPWEKPKRPWNGPWVFQASSTACRLSWNPNAGPLLLVPLNVPSSLLAHQLRCSSTGSSVGFRGAATWGADINTNSAYFPANLRNEPNLFLKESAVVFKSEYNIIYYSQSKLYLEIPFWRYPCKQRTRTLSVISNLAAVDEDGLLSFPPAARLGPASSISLLVIIIKSWIKYTAANERHKTN